MVDLVGIEPTTSSMPWKRAPSCATGPRLGARENGTEGNTKFILAHIAGIVNARADQLRRTLRITNENFRKAKPSCNFVSSWLMDFDPALILLFVSTALFCHN